MTLLDIGSMQELQTIVLFGIGSLFLYLVVPVALFANEVRLAKQSDDTSGTAAIFNSIFQAFFYIVAWSILVTIIVFLVIKFGHNGNTNPAIGIDRYWNIKWFEEAIAHTSVSISVFTTDTQMTHATLLVMIVTWAKALEYLLLGVFLALTLKLSMSLPLLKMRRADHYKMTSQIDVGTMMGMFMTGIVGWVLFVAIMTFESKLLTALVQEKAPVSHDVDIVEDLKTLVKSGMDYFTDTNNHL